MVEDRARGRWKDLQATPVRRVELAGGYLIGSMSISLAMSLLILVLAQIYIVATGGAWLDLYAYAQIVGIVLLTVATSCSMLFWIASFMQSQNAFSTVSTIVGTLIGFLTGIYIPVGSLPDAVQLLIKLFPISHAAALIRRIMTEGPLTAAFHQAPADIVDQFKSDFGIVYQLGTNTISPVASLGYLAVTGLVFFGLSMLVHKRKRHK